MATHPILQDLNPPQQEAVVTTEGPVLVLAGAGSGKTRVLTRRIAWLLDSGKARRHNILSVTFTNKAAREMAERISHLCGPGRFPNLGTFHSVCSRWLRRHAERLGIQPQFTIYDSSEQLVVMKAVLKEMNLDDKRFPPRGMLSKVSHQKNHLISADQLLKSLSPMDRDHGRMHQLYDQRLRANNAMDFDDLLVKTVELFQQHPDLLAEYQELLRYILIDEYQDVNPVQYELVRLLAGQRRNLCAVGDDDQSIYGFRGADLEILMRFESDFPDARIIKLEQNYRSTQPILDVANALVRHNQARKGKNLWTDQGRGAKPRVHCAADGREEALFLVRQLPELRRAGHRLNDVVVLYRTNAQSRLLEEALIQGAVPYNIVGGLRFYDRKEIKDVLAHLRVLLNPADTLSLRRMLDLMKGVGDTSITRVEEFARSSGMTMYDALGQAPGVPARAAAMMQGLREWMDPLMARLRQEPVAVTEVVVEVLKGSRYRELLAEENTVEAEARLENLDELLNVTGEFDRAFEGDGSPLEAFLAEVSLLSDQDTYAEEQDRITLMTVHTAKGLEFPVVFVAGLEEETFPHARSIEDGETAAMEEERRLAYVAITRARERLYLTYAQQREMRGARFPKRMSRFLKEIPEEMLDAPGQALSQPRYVDDDGPAIGSGRWQGWGRTAGTAAPPPRVKTFSGEEARKRIEPSKLPRAEREAAAAAKFAVGGKVTHKVFGGGTVTKVERDVITVAFESGKERTLSQDFLIPVAGAPVAETPRPSVVGAPTAPLQVGDRVRHSRWGNGVVKSADRASVTVVFPGITLNMSQEEARRG